MTGMDRIGRLVNICLGVINDFLEVVARMGVVGRLVAKVLSTFLVFLLIVVFAPVLSSRNVPDNPAIGVCRRWFVDPIKAVTALMLLMVVPTCVALSNSLKRFIR